MRRKIRYYRLIWLKYDLSAGLSVFLVALPLCLGIALASGAPLYAGILSGIIGGLVVSLLSGSQLAVSGPAAGLTTVVGASIIAMGDFKLFLPAVIIAGLFQLLLGTFRLGSIASYFPSSVIKGMLAAIGIMLISKQLPIALGYDQPDFWTSGFLKLFSSEDLPGNIKNLATHISKGVILITILSLGLFLVLKQPFARKLKVFPMPLLVVIIGIITAVILNRMNSPLALADSQLVNIPSNVFANISFPDMSVIFSNKQVWTDGLTIGLLATLETLLCIEAVDKLDIHNRITPPNRELMAQGAGNMLCGFLGAIPMTAVVVRGAANVDAGARTKLSAFTHGLFLLLSVLLIPFVLNMIPYASLSAILIITGYNLAKPKLFRHVYSLGWKQFLPFIITIVVVLATDLLIGVSIGLLLSIYFIVRNNFKAEYRTIHAMIDGRDTYLIKLNSNVSFLNKVNLQKALEQIPEESQLTIDGTDCNFIDHDILEIISEFSKKAEDRNIELTLKDIARVDITAIH
jgi:MFS superfamily sulfate permease-like transporter